MPIGDRCESSFTSWNEADCDTDSQQTKSVDYWVRARLAKSSKLSTAAQDQSVLSKLFALYKNTEMPPASNYVFFRLFLTTTGRIVISAYIFGIASTFGTIYVLLQTFLGRVYSTFSRATDLCPFPAVKSRALPDSCSLALLVSLHDSYCVVAC